MIKKLEYICKDCGKEVYDEYPDLPEKYCGPDPDVEGISKLCRECYVKHLETEVTAKIKKFIKCAKSILIDYEYLPYNVDTINVKRITLINNSNESLMLSIDGDSSDAPTIDIITKPSWKNTVTVN